MVRSHLALPAFALASALLACQTPPSTVRVVDRVDIDRYLGTWYEIASYPQYFQRGCVGTRAHYSRADDGRIRVVNECRDETLDGELRRAEGVAWVVDGEPGNARLRVQFFWPFSGHYWIIALDPDYRWAVVGHPDREYLWILSRTPQMDAGTYARVLDRVLDQGYALEPLQRTLQPEAP